MNGRVGIGRVRIARSVAAAAPVALAGLLAATVLAVLTVLTVLTVPGRAGAAAPVQYSQASTVTAVAVESENAQYPLLITGIDKPLSAYAAYVTGELDSTGVSDAQAAIVTPGSALEQGIGQFQGIICSSAPTLPACSAPVTNPLEAYAVYPATPTASAATDKAGYDADGVVLAGGSASATAGTATNAARASTTGGSVLAGSAAALTVGAVSSTLTQTMTPAGLVVTATSTVSHVTLAGVLTVDAITATADQTLLDGRVTARDANVTYGGVSVLGAPAEVTGTGVQVLGTGDSGKTVAALNSLLTAALAAAHVTVTAGPVDRSAAGSGGRTAASGLTVAYDQTAPTPASPTLPAVLGQQVAVPSLPSRYTGTVVLGSAGAVTGSVAIPDQTITLPASPVLPGGAVAGTAGTAATTRYLPGTPGSLASGSGPLPGAGPQVVTTGFGSTLEHWSLRAPYLVLVALAALLLAGIVRGARRRSHPDEDM